MPCSLPLPLKDITVADMILPFQIAQFNHIESKKLASSHISKTCSKTTQPRMLEKLGVDDEWMKAYQFAL